MQLLRYLYEKPMRGDVHIGGSSKSKGTISLNLIELLHTCRSTPNLVYAPGDRIAMLRGGSSSGEVDARSGLAIREHPGVKITSIELKIIKYRYTLQSYAND